MTFSFNTALSGLNASTNSLNIIGNNIANANTIGFRSGNATFEDVFANRFGARLNGAGNSLQIGNGVQTGAIHTNFEQGNLNDANSPIQAAIVGNGFFVVRNSDGTSGYTRAGDFTVNNQGFIVSNNGGQVQGYQAQNGVIPTNAPLGGIRFPIGQTLAPQVTTEGTFRTNLNSNAATGDVFNATMQVYDSLGTARTLDMTFTRQANGSFDMTATLDGNPAQTSVDGNPATTNPVNYTFDSAGNLVTPAVSLSIVPDQTQLGGAVLPAININLRDTTGTSIITSYASPSATASIAQDGYAPGELDGATIDQNGNVYGVFSNGETVVVGQYALATFNSNEGLGRLGGNLFGETIASGQATIGAPGAGGRGNIAGGQIEQSNVNITNEFVSLIEAQRGFQANSRVITTLNQTFQDLLQVI